MNCERVLEASSALCANELSPEDIRELRKHAEQCPKCCEFLESMDGVWKLLDGWKVSPAPKDCLKDFRTRFADVRRAQAGSLSLWDHFRALRGQIAISSAGVALALALLLVLLSPYSPIGNRELGMSTDVAEAPRTAVTAQPVALVPTANSILPVSEQAVSSRKMLKKNDYNLLPSELKHAGALSPSAQRSVGVIWVADGMPDNSLDNGLQADVRPVVPVEYRR